MSVPRSLSFYDLKKLPSAVAIMQRNNKEEVDYLLWQYGFDIKAGVEYIDCLHRPATAPTNEPIKGLLIVGAERQDSEWLSSEHCSDEAKIEYCEDPYMRDDLLNMSRTGSSDKVWEDDAVAEQAINYEKSKQGSE